MHAAGAAQRNGLGIAMVMTLAVALFLASGASRLFVRCFGRAHGDGGSIESVHAPGSCACPCGHDAAPARDEASVASIAVANVAAAHGAALPHDHTGCTDVALHFDCKFERDGGGNGGDDDGDRAPPAPPAVFTTAAATPATARLLAGTRRERPPPCVPLLRAHEQLLLL